MIDILISEKCRWKISLAIVSNHVLIMQPWWKQLGDHHGNSGYCNPDKEP